MYVLFQNNAVLRYYKFQNQKRDKDYTLYK